MFGCAESRTPVGTAVVVGCTALASDGCTGFRTPVVDTCATNAPTGGGVVSVFGMAGAPCAVEAPSISSSFTLEADAAVARPSARATPDW
jgi:hypothetical protein